MITEESKVKEFQVFSMPRSSETQTQSKNKNSHKNSRFKKSKRSSFQ